MSAESSKAAKSKEPKTETVPAAENQPKTKEVKEEQAEQKVELVLKSLYSLQLIDSQIDRIQNIRGELPLEVQDLEDDIVGLETRIANFRNEISDIEKSIGAKENSIKESDALIRKYKEQQMNVRNNREYDSLSKEIEFQTLEIQLSEKRIAENKLEQQKKQQEIESSEKILDERMKDLELKKSELKDIITETEKEEKDLQVKSELNQQNIDDRLIQAYKRIRKNARNGLAVVKIERDACGGCFNKIPPQHQLDIKMLKKIIVCEYCGRILVDEEIVKEVEKAK
ncbi:MAG: hypothetical protein KKA81_14050 [Bacteroidetes bacterium]|nr:hypothetical protein [Bacteroidota bacterium]